MSRRSTGRRHERNALACLEAEGYHCHLVTSPGKTFQSVDIFGCVDIIAKKLGERTRWIQVTADSGITRKADKYAEVPWDMEHDSVEIWRWKGRPPKGLTREEWKGWQHFQLYRLEHDFKPDRGDMVQWPPS